MDDIHNEVGSFVPSGINAPVAVLAGDIVGTSVNDNGDASTGIQSIKPWVQSFLLENPEVQDIVFVLGNHEMWDLDFDTVVGEYKAALIGMPNVHVLEKESIILHGIRFLGTTLWSSFRGGQDLYFSQSHIRDYQRILKGNSLLTAADTLEEHNRAKKWLTKALAQPYSGPTVVVTHHAPSFMATTERYAMGNIPGAYATNLEKLIMQHKPAAWLFGHVHVSHRFDIGDTVVTNNPRGYARNNKLNKKFDPEAYVDIEVDSL